MVEDQQTSLAQPGIRQHKFFQDHDEFAPKDGIPFLFRRELLSSSSGKVVAEVVRHLVDRHDDAGEGDLDDRSALRRPDCMRRRFVYISSGREGSYADKDHDPVVDLEFPP